MKKREKIKISFLGGVGEIGKNITAIEYGDEIIIIDVGLTFPGDNMPGIDLVIPDFSYLIENKHKVKGIFLTHGHEDHIGALPYLLKEIKAPVYGTKLTLALCDNKLREHRLNDEELYCVSAGTIVNVGSFSVEFINVNHSIAGAVAFLVSTPLGKIFISGDFKVDFTPINNDYMALSRIAEIGDEGVLLFLCESTNIEREGHTLSERVVGDTFENIFADNVGKRLIIATFASNVHRLQQILDVAERFKRKVVFSGRSMLNVAEAASKIGELKYNKDLIVDVSKIDKYKDEEIVIVSTGAQGEPMSALTRMASGEFNKVKIGENDTIILSSSPIPGNEKMVYNVINNLFKKGANVIYESLDKIHASGHACKEEIKLLHTLVRPKFFIPVHGEYRHLKRHKDLALSLGMDEKNILLVDVGNTAILTKNSLKLGESVQAGAMMVDGGEMEDMASGVLRERIKLAEDGVLIIPIIKRVETGELISNIEIINKGVICLNDQVLLNEAMIIVEKAVSTFSKSGKDGTAELENAVRKSLRNYFYKKIKTCPIIIPIVKEI